MFNETQTDSINSLDLKEQWLLSGCEDGSLIVYDLTEQDELESVELVLNAEEPVRKVNFINNDFIFYENYNGIGVYDFQLGTVKLRQQFANTVI